ncbi:MAG: hypothetical protein ACJAS1_005730 [Oleiphilaceae bacterium]|jgi:hypothetical protein
MRVLKAGALNSHVEIGLMLKSCRLSINMKQNDLAGRASELTGIKISRGCVVRAEKGIVNMEKFMAFLEVLGLLDKGITLRYFEQTARKEQAIGNVSRASIKRNNVERLKVKTKKERQL